MGSIPGLGRSPGEGHSSPGEYSGLENPNDRGAWCTTVHGVAKGPIRLRQLKRVSAHVHTHTHTHTHTILQLRTCWQDGELQTFLTTANSNRLRVPVHSVTQWQLLRGSRNPGPAARIQEGGACRVGSMAKGLSCWQQMSKHRVEEEGPGASDHGWAASQQAESQGLGV